MCKCNYSGQKVLKAFFTFVSVGSVGYKTCINFYISMLFAVKVVFFFLSLRNYKNTFFFTSPPKHSAQFSVEGTWSRDSVRHVCLEESSEDGKGRLESSAARGLHSAPMTCTLKKCVHNTLGYTSPCICLKKQLMSILQTPEPYLRIFPPQVELLP